MNHSYRQTGSSKKKKIRDLQALETREPALKTTMQPWKKGLSKMILRWEIDGNRHQNVIPQGYTPTLDSMRIPSAKKNSLEDYFTTLLQKIVILKGHVG